MGRKHLQFIHTAHTELEVAASSGLPGGVVNSSRRAFLLFQDLHGWKENFALLSLKFQGSCAHRALFTASRENMKSSSLEVFKDRLDKPVSWKALIFLTPLESKRVDWRSVNNSSTSVYHSYSQAVGSLPNDFPVCGLQTIWTHCFLQSFHATELRN